MDRLEETWIGPLLALGAAVAEGLLRWRPSLPLYRRHGGIFLVLVFLGAGLALGGLRSGYGALFTLQDALWVGGTLALGSLPWLRGRRLKGLGWCRGQARRPVPSRPLILVADPHWEGALTGLQAATAAHPEADWLFLGDLFRTWICAPGCHTPIQEAFLDWVLERRRAGRWVGCWSGNREFFLDQVAHHFDLAGEGIGGGLHEEGLAFEHGDFVAGDQWQYRLWYLVARSGLAWLVVRVLPRAYLRRLAGGLESGLRGTAQAYRVCFPREAFRQAAEAIQGSTFVTGHFHVLERVGKGWALPWAHEGAFMVWQGGEIRPLETSTFPCPGDPLT